MKPISIAILGIVASLAGFSQQQYYDFNTAVPANFSSSGISLRISNEHVKDGANALQWQVANGTVLTARDLGISSADIGGASAARFFIYSKEVTNDTLVFKFYDKDGVQKREGRMLLNYKGWRDFHRSYRFDYNYGKELPAFALDKMEIVYKSEIPLATATMYIDACRMIGDANDRVPGPHMKLDLPHIVGRVELLNDFLLTPDMEVKPASVQELAEAQKVGLLYKRIIPTVDGANLAAAKKFVDDCAIRRNADGSITGRGQLFFYHESEDTLVQASKYCAYLAEAAIHNGDEDAKTKLLDFVEYLLDQGLAEGGRLFLHLGHYGVTRSFPVGFLEGMQLYPASLKAEVIKMLKWHLGYNRIYRNEADPNPNIDYMFLRSAFLFEVMTHASSGDEWVRDLKSGSRYLSFFTEPTQGKADGMKADGCYFHHNVHYIGYCYALPAYVERVYSLKGTSYRISLAAFKNMAMAFKALFLQSSKGVLIANSLTGRNPFCAFTLTDKSLEQLAEIGGDIEGTAYDAGLASLYDYTFGTNKYPLAKTNYNGFYQFNYAQAGVVQKGNWTAVMKGFTNKLWGAEIYVSENRYGRYQSYGALELMYNGDSAASGFPAIGGNGWDWNVVPGATTIHLPFSELQAKQGRADEFQKNGFAGALSLGKHGIFAMDFAENAGKNYTASNLKFHKSVFAFNDIMVCLGSGISSTNKDSITATNLFQAVSTNSNPGIYINSGKQIGNENYYEMVSVKNAGAWVLNGQGTGYYVPKNAGDITVLRGRQTTPVETSLTGKPTVTTNFSKAFISHGLAPANANYRFVVVPAATAKQMKEYAKQFEKEALFTVLRQTDSLHAVKWLPDNTIAYAFFEANPQVNIGSVKSISGKALLGVKENKDGLAITINNPDLNTVEDPASGWRSSKYKLNLQLNGKWKVVDNPSGASISNNQQSTIIEFSLIDGSSTTIQLKIDK